MISNEQAVVGARVAIPCKKTAGTSFHHFDAEMRGGRMEWNIQNSNRNHLERKLLFVRYKTMKPYDLQYLIIDKVSTFKDDGTLCINLRRDDTEEWLGNDTFSIEDLELYGGRYNNR